MEEEFKIPEFDKEEFLKEEKRKAKTTFVSFLFGIVMAIICHFLWLSLDASIRWPLCFFLAIASIGFMAKILQILNIDISQFSKKEWAGSIAFYFFTWLAIFILSLNPPFYDASPPKIELVLLPEIQQNGSILVLAHITDNAGLRDVHIKIDNTSYEMEKDGTVYVFNYSGKNADFEVVAIDENGNEASKNGKFLFKEDLIKVETEKERLSSDDKIEIWVMKNISKENFRVFYRINGYEINATKDGEENGYIAYITTPAYEGWEKNSQNEIEVYVEVIHYFAGIDKKYSNLIYGGIYKINTTEDENIGVEESPQIKDLPKPHGLRTPGFEFAVLVLAIAIILAKRRHRARRQ